MRLSCILGDLPGTSSYHCGYPWWMTWGQRIPLVLCGLLALVRDVRPMGARAIPGT